MRMFGRFSCVLAMLLAPTTVTGRILDEAQVTPDAYEYVLLATGRTSTMEKEMNEAAERGHRFLGVMGGDTAFGGQEVVVIMGKSKAPGRYAYRLLATSRTSTMQQEMQAASDDGYEYRGQTVFETLFGGREVVVIMERNNDAPIGSYEYLLLATSKTTTMEKELAEAGATGFEFVGMTVGETAFGGNELVVITRRVRSQNPQ